MTSHTIRPLVTNNWFLLVAPVVVLSSALVASAGPIDRVVELGLLFDLTVLVPVLYLLCYRKRRRGAAIRAIGLACLGVWIATKLIPEADRVLLVYVEPLRYVGLAVLVFLELFLIRVIFQSLSAGDTAEHVASKVSEASEMPKWVARLLAWEAGMWRKLFSRVGRLFRRDRNDA